MPKTSKNNAKRIVIEFNETSSEIGLESYAGQQFTPDLLKKFQKLDQLLVNAGFGYFKFYFDVYVNDEIVDHIRLDLGDGIKVNQQEYEMLKQIMD